MKREALQRGLPVVQPSRVKAPEVLEYLTTILGFRKKKYRLNTVEKDWRALAMAVG